MEELPKKETKEVRRKETKEQRKKETKEVPKKEREELREKERKKVRRKEMEEVRKKEMEEVRRRKEMEEVREKERKELRRKEMKELRKKEMKELHKIAWVYYEVGAPEIVKEDVREFYQKMACTKEDNLNQEVKLHEFLAFTKKEGLSKISNPKFFKDLIFTEGNDSIGFWEIVTLYYILASRRPFCDGCGNFIKGTFFPCAKCFHCKSASFNICISCFEKQKYKHEHKDQFLDNVLLLEMSRKPECQCCKTSPRAMNSKSPAGNQLVQRKPNNSSLKEAIILWRILSSGVSTGAAIASIATALSCSIL